MKKEMNQSCGGTNKDMYAALNKRKSDKKERKRKISVRLNPTLLNEIEKASDNRSKAIRTALRIQYLEAKDQ